MWQYQYTDELYHYKYIRKYNKNGHTYYIRDNKEEKLHDAAAKAALATANKIGEKGYINSKGYHVTNKIHDNMITNTHTQSTQLKRQTAIDKAKELVYNKASSIVYNHSKQKIKDIPKKIFAIGLSTVSSIIKKIRKD